MCFFPNSFLTSLIFSWDFWDLQRCPDSLSSASSYRSIIIVHLQTSLSRNHCLLFTHFVWQGMNSRTDTPVETWAGPKGKQSYTYIIEKNGTMSFTWAFQRTAYHEAVRLPSYFLQIFSQSFFCYHFLEGFHIRNCACFCCTNGEGYSEKCMALPTALSFPCHHFPIL